LKSEKGLGERGGLDKLVDGQITRKINDSSQLIGGSSWKWMWEGDKVVGD